MESESLIFLREALRNRYEVFERIGEGSMGVVYKCRYDDPNSGPTIVAVKQLHPELTKDAKAVKRFRAEIVAGYTIKHPNVVRPIEIFRAGDIFGICMEYVDGGDLATYMKNSSPLPLEECVRIISELASALEAVHEAGIVHRDLKPENVLVTSAGQMKLADFGTAVLIGGPRLTDPGKMLGTVNYVCPEYIQSSHLDLRSDIYALGVIGYELISGELPFAGESIVQILQAKNTGVVTPLRELCQDCPQELGDLVAKAMDRDPEARFQSCSELLDGLADIS